MPKLLLVDDSDSNRVTLSVLLEEEGFSVQTADSFTQARETLGGTTVFDGVLLDQNLGDGRGTDLVPLIKERMPNAKVLLISGSVREDQVPTVGLDGIVTKGAAFPDVLELLQKALAVR